MDISIASNGFFTFNWRQQNLNQDQVLNAHLSSMRFYDGRMTSDLQKASPAPDASEFDRFVEGRSAALLRFVANLGAQPEDAKDLLQETLLRMMRYRDSAPAHEWTPLAYRILLNLHRDKQRQAANTRHVPFVEMDDQTTQQSSHGKSPERTVSDIQQLEHARAAILSLPDRCREVYLLNRVEGLSYPSIAQRCGISVKAVEKHISRALRELRAKVDRTLSAQEES